MATTSVTTEVEAATSLPNTRQCPGCLKLLQYKNRSTFRNAIRREAICAECYHKKPVSTETRLKQGQKVRARYKPQNFTIVENVAWLHLRKADETEQVSTQFDAAQLERVKQRRWYYDGRYVVDSGLVGLHRFLLDLQKGCGLEGDHINGDKLDNRLGNLRVVTPAQQHQNRLDKASCSGHRNVVKAPNGWRVRVKLNGVKRNGGTFKDLTEAVQAARELRKALYTHNVEDRHVDPQAVEQGRSCE